jgi:hypothetical protein
MNVHNKLLANKWNITCNFSTRGLQMSFVSMRWAPWLFLGTVVAVLCLATDAKEADKCEPLLTPLQELSSFLAMEGQASVRRNLAAGVFRDPEELAFSYLTKNDENIYLQAAQQFRARLSSEQTDAFNQYSGQGGTYQAVNQFFQLGIGERRQVTLRQGRARVSNTVPQIARTLETIYESAPPLPLGLILFRGIASNRGDITIPRKGGTLKFPQLLSTSLDSDTGYHFASYNRSDHRVIFIIKIAGPVKGLLVGNAKEYEVILPRNVVLRVESKRTVLDKHSRYAQYTIVEVSALGQKFSDD